MLSDEKIDQFIRENRLPDEVRNTIEIHFLPLARRVEQTLYSKKPFFLGISGAQGTGKSTLAGFLKIALESGSALRVATLSLDDFYLSKKQRKELGAAVHPLLETRGVPGTHAVQELTECLEKIQMLSAGASVHVPQFDKARDDRAETYTTIDGPVDLVILEGWCVGGSPQDIRAIQKPINELEHKEDSAGVWRGYANDQLAGAYASLFKKMDALVFLQAPDFEAVYRWRLEQEQKLGATALQARDGLMSSKQVAQFIQHYERLTRANLASIPGIADVVLEFDESHKCIRSLFADGFLSAKD